MINSKTFKQETTIQLSHWTNGYNWAKSNKEVISILNVDITKYYLPSDQVLKITEKEMC
jgi:hypothetical protein